VSDRPACVPPPRRPQLQLARSQGGLEAASSEREGLRQLVGKAEEKMSQLAQQLELEVAARRDSEQQCEQLSVQAAAASSRADALQQHAEQLDAALHELRQQEAAGGRLVHRQEDSIVALQEQLGGLLGAMTSFADELERVVPVPFRYLVESPPRGALALHDSGGWARRLGGVLEMIRLSGQQLQEMTSQVRGLLRLLPPLLPQARLPCAHSSTALRVWSLAALPRCRWS
jgi:hypothetical protein